MRRPTAHSDSRSRRLGHLSWGCRGRRQATRWAPGSSNEPTSVADVAPSPCHFGIQTIARGIARDYPLQTLVDSAYLAFHEDWMKYAPLMGTPEVFGEDFGGEVRAICTAFNKVYIDVWAVNGCTRLVNECMTNPSNHPAFRAHLAAICAEAWKNFDYMVKHRHVQLNLADEDTSSSSPDDGVKEESPQDQSSLGQLDPQGPIVIITPPAPDNHVYEKYWKKAGYSRPLSKSGNMQLEPGRLRVPWCSVKYGEIETPWDSSLPNWHFNRFPPGLDNRWRSARISRTALRRSATETYSPCPSSNAVAGVATTKSGRKRAKRAEAERKVQERDMESLEKREKAKEIARVAANCQAAFDAMLSRIEPSPSGPIPRPGGKKFSTAPPKLLGRRKAVADPPAQIWGTVANWPPGSEDEEAGRTSVGPSHKPRKST